MILPPSPEPLTCCRLIPISSAGPAVLEDEWNADDCGPAIDLYALDENSGVGIGFRNHHGERLPALEFPEALDRRLSLKVMHSLSVPTHCAGGS